MSDRPATHRLDVRVGVPRPVAPGPAEAGTARAMRANNNLDVVDHAGRRYLAWRTAPTHFAHHDVHLHVVVSDDRGETWHHQRSFHLGRDLREPRFLEWEGRLHLYCFTLGTTWYRFEPGEVHHSELGDGGWSDLEPITTVAGLDGSGVVEWRPRVLSGRPVMTIYRGADSTYSARPEPNRVELWTTDDGREWRALDPDHPVAHVGGTETELVEAPRGGWVGVTRIEGPHGFGSDVCRADEPGPRSWRTRRHARKLDSPFSFRHGDDVLVVARRQVAFGGRYDLGWSWPSPPWRTKLYQLLYWATPKRSALWRLDPDTLDVEWVVDLPSAGDCSFAAVVSEGGDDVTVYDYSSPLRPGWRPWFVGQLRPTAIRAIPLRIRAVAEDASVSGG